MMTWIHILPTWLKTMHISRKKEQRDCELIRFMVLCDHNTHRSTLKYLLNQKEAYIRMMKWSW